MPTNWKIVRVFISSTFRDMQAERDWLVKRVFPALRFRLESSRIHLVDIDLRWGITKEQADNDQVLGLCLQQIDECRPFFLGILGGRYGWVPSKFPVEVGTRYGWTQAETDKSVTELEILHGVLNDPSMYERALFCFRSECFLNDIDNEHQRRIFMENPTDEELEDVNLGETFWYTGKYSSKFKRLIHRIKNLRGVISKVPTDENSRKFGSGGIKYRAGNRSNQLNELKKRIKRLSPPILLFDGYPCRWNKVLIDPISKTLGRLDGLNEFGAWVAEKLEQAILNAPELQEHLANTRNVIPSELDEERDFHEQFIENRIRFYIGREQLQDELKAYALGPDTKPCLLVGPSGSGKSAALAKFVSVWRTQHLREVIIPHFIGASPRSTSLRGMLRHLNMELKTTFNLEEEIKQDVGELANQFGEFLGKVPGDLRVLLVFDALNQLDESDNAHSLYWLPRQLPLQVRLMVSCIVDPDRPDQPTLSAMRRNEPYEIKVGLLTDDERLGIVNKIPSAAAKALDEKQVRLLLENKATRNPLYLLIALEELRGFGSFEALNKKIAGLPQIGDTLTAIFQQVIRRLGEDFSAITVKDLLTLLTCSRRGLSERELLDLLDGEQVPIDKSTGDLFPILRQLRPYLQFRGPLLDFYHRHLAKAIHEEFFKANDTVQWRKHQRLSDYFDSQSYFLESLEKQRSRANHLPPTPRSANIRKVDELPWQRLSQAKLTGEWGEVEQLFINLFFLEAKTEAGMVFDLVSDFTQTLKILPAERPWYPNIRLLKEALRRDVHFIASQPTTLFQCMWNSCWWYDCPEIERHYKGNNSPVEKKDIQVYRLLELWRQQKEQVQPGFNWLRSSRPPLIALGMGMIAVFSGHTSCVSSVAISPNGKVLASGSWDHTVRLWDMGSGKEKFTLIGHGGPVSCLDISPDGQIVASASHDHTVRLWNVESGHQMYNLSTHNGHVNSLCFSPDGKIVASASHDHTVKLWMVESGLVLHVLSANGVVNGVCFSPDGKTVGSASRSVELWNVETGGKITTLIGNWNGLNAIVHKSDSHAGSAHALAFHPGGRILASGAGGYVSGEIKLWDIKSGKEAAALIHGHLSVSGVKFSSDGRVLAGLAEDHTIKLWSIPDKVINGKFAEIRELGILASDEHCLSFSPNGSILASGGGDNTIRLWETGTVSKKRTLINHWDDVLCLTFSPDGRMCATGGSDCLIKVWNTDSGTELKEMVGHLADVSYIAFCLNGRELVSWGHDGTLRLWDIASGTCLDTKKGWREIHSEMPENWPILSTPAGVMDECDKIQICGGETIVRTNNNETHITYYPVVLRNATIDDHRRYIVGIDASTSHIHLLALEGSAFTAGE